MDRRKYQIWKGAFCLLTAVLAFGTIFFLFNVDDSYSYERYLASLPEGEEPGTNGGAIVFIIYAVCCSAALVFGGAWCIRAGIEYIKGKPAFWYEVLGKGGAVFALAIMLSLAKMPLAIAVYSAFIAYMVASLIVSVVWKRREKGRS